MEAYQDILQLLKALADENRLHIVEVLTKECKSVNDIVEAAGLSQPLTSHHLKVLKNAGIARVENRASFNFYWITDEVIWKIIENCKEFIRKDKDLKLLSLWKKWNGRSLTVIELDNSSQNNSPISCWGSDTDAGQHLEGNTENCKICGSPLEYFDYGRMFTCANCSKQETANICCPNGHYICDECHGKGVFALVKEYVLTSESQDPLEIAEALMNFKDQVPMLGCENAWIAAGALMAAIKNEGTLKITDAQILEVLNRTHRQAIGGYCGLTGVCGIAPGIGACFSVILGAACPKDRETATTMTVVAKIVNVIAQETGPCCCKNFVRHALTEAVALVKEILNISLTQSSVPIVCTDVERHPHGCRREKCSYYHMMLKPF